MEDFDFLVVGSGLAGSLMAMELYRQNKSVCWYCVDLPGGSSLPAAGLMNPITGMRYVKSWEWEALMSVALPYYHSLEELLDTKLIHRLEIFQKLNSIEEENAWLSRTADPEYQKYIKEPDKIWPFQSIMKDSSSYGKIVNAFRLNIVELLTKIRHYLQNKIVVKENSLDHKKLKVDNHAINDGQLRIHHKILFCEGYRMIHNPFFNYLPLVPLKGDFIHTNWDPELNNLVYKSDYTLIPIEAGTAWLGSNYSLHDTGLQTDQAEIEKQTKFAQEIFNDTVNIQKRGFGIRPSTRDRRPLLGIHPNFQSMYVVNGFGTKGASLAPYCVKMAIDNLIHNRSLEKSIDIKRFERLIPIALKNDCNINHWLN